MSWECILAACFFLALAAPPLWRLLAPCYEGPGQDEVAAAAEQLAEVRGMTESLYEEGAISTLERDEMLSRIARCEEEWARHSEGRAEPKT